MTNIDVTQGSGKTVSTETIGGAEYQRVKIIDGTASGTTPLKVNADGSLNLALTTVSVMNTMPSSMLVGASIIGLTPVNVGVPFTVADNAAPNGIAFQGATATGSATVIPYLFNGSNYDRLRGNSSTGALVNTGSSSVIVVGTFTGGNSSVQLVNGNAVIGSVAAFQAGTWASSVFAYQAGTQITSISGTLTIAAFTSGASIVGTYVEDAAHSTGDRGLFTLKVRNDTMSSITSADGDYSPLSVGPVGEAIVANSPITKWFSQSASIMYGTSVQVVAPPGASVYSYITGIHVMNESPNFSRVTITQGLGGVNASILNRSVAPATGGSNANFINGIRVLDNNGISASISGISSVYVTITGFNSKV